MEIVRIAPRPIAEPEVNVMDSSGYPWQREGVSGGGWGICASTEGRWGFLTSTPPQSFLLGSLGLPAPHHLAQRVNHQNEQKQNREGTLA